MSQERREWMEMVSQLRQEIDRLKAELAADCATQPCGHAKKWLAYRNAVDIHSERYCVFCEIARLRERLSRSEHLAGDLNDDGNDLADEIERARALLREIVEWHKARPREGWLDDAMWAIEAGCKTKCGHWRPR